MVHLYSTLIHSHNLQFRDLTGTLNPERFTPSKNKKDMAIYQYILGSYMYCTALSKNCFQVNKNYKFTGEYISLDELLSRSI